MDKPADPAPDLPVLEVLTEDEPAGLLEEAPRTVLITGAGGVVGRKLRTAWAGRYDLIALDSRVVPDDPELILADLTTWDEDWAALFDEADTVVHLAASADPGAKWPALAGPNIEALAHVLLAAAQSGVDRVVFASSCHVFDGPDWPSFGQPPLPPDATPAGGSPYGASKLAGERMGRAFAAATGLAFIALRIGWVQKGENQTDTLGDHPDRGLWLSDRDLAQLVTRAVEAELGEGAFLAVVGVSDNEGSPWSWREAETALGYRPEDGLGTA